MGEKDGVRSEILVNQKSNKETAETEKLLNKKRKKKEKADIHIATGYFVFPTFFFIFVN